MFANLSIKMKIVSMLVLPIAGMLCFSLIDGRTQFKTLHEIKMAGALVDLSLRAGLLVHELQKERGMSAGFIGSKGSNFASELPRQRALSDGQLKAFHGAKAPPSSGAALMGAMDSSGEALAGLQAVRERISALDISAALSFEYYSAAIESLLNLSSAGYTSGSIALLVADGLNLGDFLRYKEKAGQERATLNEVLSTGRFTEETYRRFIGIMAVQDADFALFSQGAHPDRLAWVRQRLATAAAATVDEYLAKVLATKPGESFGIAPKDWFAAMTGKIDSMKECEDYLASMILADARATEKSASRDLGIMLVVVSIMATLTAIFVTMMYLAIARPLNRLVLALGSIASGEGDLTQRLPAKSKDEIGRLASHFNLTMEKIGAMVRAIGDSTETLGLNGETLSSNMSETASALNEIHANIEGMRQKTIDQSASVTETQATIEEISRGIVKLDAHIEIQAQSVGQSSAAIEEMVASINSVTESLSRNALSVDDLSQSAEEGSASMDEVAALVSTIARESEGLIEASSVIQRIADQTNLLAMNAAIEAAHAGDFGKGFAVVADEIRKLAENAREQALTISNVLTSLKDLIDKGSHASGLSQSQFQAVYRLSQMVRSQEALIKGAMEEQSLGGAQILESIQKISEITVQVKNGSAQMLQGSAEIRGEMQRLSDVTDDMRSSMNEMALGTNQINSSANHISELGKENRDRIIALRGEVGRFTV